MKCKVCNHPNRLEIEEDMQNSELSQSEVATKYHLYPQVISNHVPHIAYDIRGRLEELIKASLTTKVPPESVGDLARLLSEYRAFTALEDKCETCSFKTKSTLRTIEDATRDFLDGSETDIYVTLDEYSAFRRWIETLPTNDPDRAKHDAWKKQLVAWHGPAEASIPVKEASIPVSRNEVFIPENIAKIFGVL